MKDRKVKNSVQFQGRERITVKTTVEKIEKVCSYGESNQNTSGCALKECRGMGIDWFTPDNTFFLKYPDGFSSIPDIDKLEMRGFVFDDRRLNAEYHKKLGSYTLTALLSYENGKATGISAYRIANCRRWYVFRYENGAIEKVPSYVLALIASATAVSLPVSFDVPAPMAYTSHWLEDDHLEPS